MKKLILLGVLLLIVFTGCDIMDPDFYQTLSGHETEEECEEAVLEGYGCYSCEYSEELKYHKKCWRE